MTSPLSTAAPSVADYVLDSSATSLGFVARHALVTKVPGRFEEVWGHAHLDLENPAESWVKVDLQAASVNTNNDRRDAHLRSKDFLDAHTHPVISYRSLRVSRLSDTSFKIVGELTIRGVTRMLPLVFEYDGTRSGEHEPQRLAFRGSAVISRRLWGVSWNGTLDRGGAVIADRVALELDVVIAQARERVETADAVPPRSA